ncbi:MAG: protein kinase domain-containing protein [Aridibacter sp.]
MSNINYLTKNQTIEIPELGRIYEDDQIEFVVIETFQGGMGICAKVQNISSGNIYALKTIQTKFVEDHQAWTMFVEEMKTWLTLSACDGVVEAYCLTKINEIPYVCAKWMEGGELRSKMSSKDSTFFFNSIIRIIRTLEWANTKYKIIHRDLKPENILLDQSGLAYVTDWGLARPIAKSSTKTKIGKMDSSRPELTQAGEFKGTITYASPEQILGNENIDHRSDIYSLGCIFYEWETGIRPFTGNTAEEIALKHLMQPAQQIGSFFRRTNFGVEKIIYKCLEKEPFERFQTYESLADAVIKVAKARGVAFTEYIPNLRYSRSEIGKGELSKYVPSDDPSNIKVENKKYTLVEFDKLKPYLVEAEALMQLQEWQKAAEIYGRFFVPQLINSDPNSRFSQSIAINYSLCLINTDNPELAVKVLSQLESAKSKPATYFLQLSLAYLHIQKPNEAEHIAQKGISIFTQDKDIWGNLLIAQIHQDKLVEAQETAKIRLSLGRDVHSLEEIATIFKRIADSEKDSNLPNAVENYRYALELLNEAKDLNPRYATARLSLANVLFEMHQYTEASEEISQITQLPIHKNILELALVKLSMCLDRTGQHKECMDFCDKWLEKFPDSIGLKRIKSETIVDGFCIGRLHNGNRVVDGSSLEFFENIVNKEKERKVSDFCYLARLYEWMGKIDEAFQLLEKAKLISPKYWEIPFNVASFCHRLEDFEEAERFALDATKLSPWRTQSWRLLSAIYESLELYSDSENALEQAEFVQEERDRLFQQII